MRGPTFGGPAPELIILDTELGNMHSFITVKLVLSQSSGYLITRVAARTTNITARILM